MAQSADAQESEISTPAEVENNSLHDFSSDGCSMSPDGSILLFKTEFVPCCVQHDVAYWQGGTAAEKLTADKNLRTCIAEKSKSNFIANVYYRGVRMGGGASLPTSFHWGYGWEKRRHYEPLSEEQKQIAQEKLEHVNWVQIYSSLGIDLVN
ncbi:Prokaryotic phospholipase A2 [compost metagenome]